MSSDAPRIRVLHLYDEYLNIYADRGNIAVLRARCAWRGITCDVRGLAPGESFAPEDADLIYVGGGQDSDQALVAEELATRTGPAIRTAVENGAALLAVCGGYQLLGHEYVDTTGATQPGVGLLPLTTHAGTTRLIGNVAIDATLPQRGAVPGVRSTIVGFENHAGRTALEAGATPLGRVTYGFGNDGVSGTEGCVVGGAVGTYLHGPLLPRNPQVADWLIKVALQHAGDDIAAINWDSDDTVEDAARAVSLARARHEPHATRGDRASTLRRLIRR